MTGFGILGTGGSLSPSSNLSPLAPPFTVDRSSPRPNSSSAMHFTEPPYAVPFPSSFPSWPYSPSSSSRPDFYGNPDSSDDSIRTTHLFAPNDYQFLGSHSVSSPGTIMHQLDINVSASSSTSNVLQYELPRSHVEAKPYYPQFVSTVVDEDTPLVALNESKHDSLSSSPAAPFDGSSKFDYVQNLSGLEYTSPQWCSFWNKLADGKHGERGEVDGNFLTEASDDTGSYIYKNHGKEGDYAADGKPSAVSDRKCSNVFARENYVVSPSMGDLMDKSTLLQDPRFISGCSSKTSISGSLKIPTSHAQLPSLESTTFWNHQYDASYDNCFTPVDSCMNDCMSVRKTSPSVVIRPPSTGTTSTVFSTVSSGYVSSTGNTLENYRNDVGYGYVSRQVEPHLFVASSSTIKQEFPNKSATEDVLDHISKGGMDCQLPGVPVPDGFTLAHDYAKGFNPVEDSSDTVDLSNPAVDSPCWKGTPACLSPGEVSEAVTPQCFMEKSRVSGGLNLQHTPVFLPCVGDNVRASTEKDVYQENGYVELGSLLSPEKLSVPNWATKEHSPANSLKIGNSCPDQKTSQAKQLDPEKSEFISEIKSKPCAEIADKALNVNDTLNNGALPFDGTVFTPCLASSAEDVNRLAKSHTTESSPKVNVSSLVNTIHNLTELLLHHCSNNDSEISEQDRVTMKHSISNIDACLSKKIVHMTPTQESMFPQQGTQECTKLPVLQKVVATGSLLVTEADTISCVQFEHDILSGKEVENFSSIAPLMDEADMGENDNVVQAIKQVLEKDFVTDEEMQAETLLFKNLWLEAEAALCSISYRARFNRMKIEMEKNKSHQAKGTEEAVKDIKQQQPSYKVSTGPKLELEVSSEEAKHSLMSNKSDQDPPISSTINIDDDIESSSVMARFHILKSRGQKSTSVGIEGQNQTEVVDAEYAGDQEIQTVWKNRLGSQLHFGKGNISSSDWEHVLKDEFARQN
ncbi:hypothetical protein NMG60_11017908 [Bertholletia excelsa]